MGGIKCDPFVVMDSDEGMNGLRSICPVLDGA